MAKVIDSYLERRKAARPDAMSEVTKLWDRLDKVEKDHAAEVDLLRRDHAIEMLAMKEINAGLLQRLGSAEQEVHALRARVIELERGIGHG